MTRTNTNVTLNAEDLALAKSKGMNISSFIRETLAAHLRTEESEGAISDKELIAKLRATNAIITTRLNEVTKERDKHHRHIRELRNELEDLKEKIRRKNEKRFTPLSLPN